MCNLSSLIWRSTAQRWILAVSLREDIVLRSRETSGCWGKIFMLFADAAECFSFPLLGGELSKQAKTKHPPGPPAKLPA